MNESLYGIATRVKQKACMVNARITKFSKVQDTVNPNDPKGAKRLIYHLDKITEEIEDLRAISAQLKDGLENIDRNVSYIAASVRSRHRNLDL